MARPFFEGNFTAGRDLRIDVTFAGWRLTLEPMILPWRREARLAPGSILDPRYGVVPFQDRLELHDIVDWCLAPAGADDPIRLYSAPGGMGKTRLLIETCRTLREGHGWKAGFLADASRQEAAQFAETEGPTLIVVDYAEGKVDTVAALIESFHRRWLEGDKLRLVLLARDGPAPAPPGDERPRITWIEALRQRGGAATQERVSALEAVALAPLAESTASRAALFESAKASLAGALFEGQDATTTLAAAAAAPDLSDDTFRRVLFVHAAALASLEGRTLSTAMQLLGYLADREERAWQRGLQDLKLDGRLPVALMGQAAALVTLHGGADDRAAARALVGRAPLAEGQTTADLERLTDILRQLYPGSRHVEPVQPDLIGEQIVERQLDREPDLLSLALTPEAKPVQAFEILRRLSDRRPDRLPWLVSASEILTGRLAEGSGTARLAFDLLPLLPSDTVALREFRHRVVLVCLEALPAASPPELRAVLLSTRAVFAGELGHREDALAAAQEAADLYRNLARARPDAFRPGLAMSLNNLANMLSDLGRREDALTAAQEAVELRRDLARARPDAFRPDLAMSLNNLARTLSDLGRREDARAAAQEAVELRRDLARARPDAFLPDLAGSLNTLANRLSDLGKRKEALAAAQEAVELRRDLARARPDAFRPDLALSLNTLANRLSDLGRHEDARAVAQEAADLYRNLARARPDAFEHYLAGSLNNLANSLSDLGRHEDALTAAQEAADLYRDLARARPDAFKHYLAGSLNNLAAMLSNIGRREDALTGAKEAADLYRDLARARPDVFRPDLAMSLNNLANMLGDIGRDEDALAAAQEAVGLYRDLAQTWPAVFQTKLALATWTFANCQDRLSDREAALASIKEAMSLLAPIFLRHPQAVTQWMVPMCRQYIERCEKLGREPDGTLLAPIAEMFEKLQQPEG